MTKITNTSEVMALIEKYEADIASSEKAVIDATRELDKAEAVLRANLMDGDFEAAKATRKSIADKNDILQSAQIQLQNLQEWKQYSGFEKYAVIIADEAQAAIDADTAQINGDIKEEIMIAKEALMKAQCKVRTKRYEINEKYFQALRDIGKLTNFTGKSPNKNMKPLRLQEIHDKVIEDLTYNKGYKVGVLGLSEAEQKYFIYADADHSIQRLLSLGLIEKSDVPKVGNNEIVNQ